MEMATGYTSDSTSASARCSAVIILVEEDDLVDDPAMDSDHIDEKWR